MNRLENRLNYGVWNKENHLVIPRDKVEEYRDWYNENKKSFEEIGLTDRDMFEYFATCMRENKGYSIQNMLK